MMRNPFSYALILSVVCVSIAPDASASEYQFTISPAASTAATSSSVTAPLAGTFKGNYDPKTNPDGTMTRPGLFGGSGNMPIPYSGNVTGGGSSNANPGGQYRLDLQPGDGLIYMSGFTLDALAGQQPNYPATFNMLYQTFRTFQPNSTYIGGIPLPIPLGEFTLTSLTMVQTVTSPAGSMLPAGKNQYEFSVLIEVMVSFTGDMNGSPVVGDFPALLNITGDITVAGNTATADITIDWSVSDTNNGPFDPFVDIPLDVPTILPAGSTAHLLISGQIQSITTNMSVDATLHAPGVLYRPGDINGDGVVNVNDLLLVINAWGACPAPPLGCPPDIAPQPHGDGVVNVNDLLLVINNWG